MGGVIAYITGEFNIVAMRSEEEGVTVKEVHAIIQLVMCVLGEVGEVVARHNWDTTVGDIGRNPRMAKYQRPIQNIVAREGNKGRLCFRHQVDCHPCNRFQPGPMKLSSPLVDAGARGAGIHCCQDDAVPFGNKTEAGCWVNG